MSKDYLQQAEESLVDTGWGNYRLEQRTFDDLKILQAEAQQVGIDIKVCSTFRSFGRQLEIWNQKALGEKPLYDRQGKLVQKTDFDKMSDTEKVDLITTWFAVPGLSRHHFGTDFDYYDRETLVKNGLTLQLIPWEYADSSGPCSEAYQWLQNKSNQELFPFYWPFTAGACGVAEEPWHLSHKVASATILERFNKAEFQQRISNADIVLKAGILPQLDKLIEYHGFPI